MADAPSVCSGSIATLPPFIEGHKWFFLISCQWESQKIQFAYISLGKIQFLPPCIWDLPTMTHLLCPNPLSPWWFSLAPPDGHPGPYTGRRPPSTGRRPPYNPACCTVLEVRLRGHCFLQQGTKVGLLLKFLMTVSCNVKLHELTIRNFTKSRERSCISLS